jgi:hypothetical protein
VNLELHEFDVEFDQEVTHYDTCQDYSHTSRNPGYKSTWRIVCNEREEWVARAWLAQISRSRKDFRLIAHPLFFPQSQAVQTEACSEAPAVESQACQEGFLPTDSSRDSTPNSKVLGAIASRRQSHWANVESSRCQDE